MASRPSSFGLAGSVTSYSAIPANPDVWREQRCTPTAARSPLNALVRIDPTQTSSPSLPGNLANAPSARGFAGFSRSIAQIPFAGRQSPCRRFPR